MITNRPVLLSDQIFDQLEGDILKGVYKRGDIITETQVSEKLGVSRTPVREAMRRLEQEHMIEDSSKGMIVVGISDRDAECIYEIRERIEGLAAREAALNASGEQINQMKETLDMQEYYISKGDIEKIREMDSRFHELMYKASASSVLCDTLMSLHRKVQKYRMNSVSHSDRATKSINEHRKIYEALEKRDPDAAEKATTEHVVKAKTSILTVEDKK